jgi:heptose-I-phosphate ethanolaminephosphotransferase
MGIYGYYRETTPLLNKRKNQLKVFQQVISPNVHTIPALGKILTLENTKDLSKKYNQTLVQLFNASGFKTYWLSNQAALGINETSTRRISKISQSDFFTDGNLLDEVLLPQLKKILNDKCSKKFIVLHLMGTHGAYNKRYPSKFEVFKSKPQTIFPSELAYKSINEYDNAILYNDFIVDQIINQIEEKNTYSSVLYLADHGDDVYQSINTACHNEDRATKPMFDIPFIIWMSKKYKEDRQDLTFNTKRKYNSESLFHSVADLANIDFPRFDATKSIINHSFLEKERIILNGQKYETVYNKK